jgi:SPP1 family predicted phage head-tail adaptor
MNFGKLDRLVTLRKPLAPAQDEYGAPAPVSWVEVAKVYAEQKPGHGNEAMQAQQLTAVQLVTWLLRYRPDVQPTWQLIYGGTIYEITAVAEIGRRVGLTLTTQARGPVAPPIILPPTPTPTTGYQATYTDTY